jgi:tetratricopeptide (TPR) repeat protein
MRKPTAPSRTRLDDLSTGELIARSESLLSARNYRDAIDVYKLLLKREPQAEAGWRESLAGTYLERARELAGKAMYREAAVLWENIPSLCGQSPQPELYVGWLLHSGQYAKAVRVYVDHAAALTGAGELETLLAALALTGQKDVLQALPQDAPTRRQLTATQNALRAYSRGESEEAVRECLQHIPIRSPYRDLRQALAALLKLETDPAGATALVDRIPTTSPYHGLAEIVRACAAAEPLRTLPALDPPSREIAINLLGLEPRQIKLLKEWARLGAAPSDKAIFGFITANLAALDRDQARRASLALLPAYPPGLAIHVKLFGPLPPYQSQRLQALKAERDGDLQSVLHHWRSCADLLAQDTADPDNRLMAALVLRHLARLLAENPPLWFVEARAEDLLADSLQLDPDDRDTYLQLAKLHQDAGNDKEYHQWVERAVKQFPDDPQVLLAAVATATARKAYKKAAGFAARVLELDPINSKARHILLNSHLAHARKQILAGKHELATRELDSAAQLERDNARSGVIEINRGLLAFTQRQRERARQWLREGTRIVGNPLLARLRLTVEASRLRLEPSLFLRDLELGDPGKFTVDRTDLLAMVQMLGMYREEGVEDLGAALDGLVKPLKRAIKALSAEDDLLSVCECLHQGPHQKLLEYAATHALDGHPERPPFVYFQIFGRAEGNLNRVKDRDYQRLEDAHERAAATKDHRAKLLIERFLDQDLFHLPRPRPGSAPHTDMDQLGEILEQLPPPLRDRLLGELMDELPIDADNLPPEARKVFLKALLSGGGDLADFLDSSDFPLPSPDRSRRKKRRS